MSPVSIPSYMPVLASSSTLDRQSFPRGPVTTTIPTAGAFFIRHLRVASTSLTLIRLTICFLVPFFALTLLGQAMVVLLTALCRAHTIKQFIEALIYLGGSQLTLAFGKKCLKEAPLHLSIEIYSRQTREGSLG